MQNTLAEKARWYLSSHLSNSKKFTEHVEFVLIRERPLSAIQRNVPCPGLQVANSQRGNWSLNGCFSSVLCCVCTAWRSPSVPSIHLCSCDSERISNDPWPDRLLHFHGHLAVFIWIAILLTLPSLLFFI